MSYGFNPFTNEPDLKGTGGGTTYTTNAAELKYTRVLVHGHSIAASYSAIYGGWDNRLLRLMGIPDNSLNNRAISGALIGYPTQSAGVPTNNHDGGIGRLLQDMGGFTQPTDTYYVPLIQLGILWHGLNDIAAFGTGTNATHHIQETLIAGVAAYRSAKFFFYNDASIATTGSPSTVSQTTYNLGSALLEWTTSGTFTITVPSTFPGGTVNLFLNVAGGASPNGGVITWTVDSVAAGSNDYRGDQQATTFDAYTPDGVRVKRFTGLAAGSHTILGTITSASANGIGLSGWSIEAPTAPIVLLPKHFRLYNEAYIPIGTNVWTTALDATAIAAMNTITDNVVAQFDAYVITCDTQSVINRQLIYYFSDQAHLNDRGYGQIAGAFYDALRALAVTAKHEGEVVNAANTFTTATDLAAYLKLAGVSGGQSAFGGTAAADTLSLQANSTATTAGSIRLNSDVRLYDADQTYVANRTFLDMAKTYTVDFLNGSLGQMIQFSGTAQWNQNANGFGMGSLFNNVGTIKNVSGVTVNLGPFFTLVAQPKIQADNATIVMSALIDVTSQPSLSVVGTGVLTLSAHTAFNVAGGIATGATVTTKTGYSYTEPSGTGTIGTQYGMDIGALTKGTGNAIGIRIQGASGSSQRAALLLSSTAGGANNGITFGTIATDAQLYRQAFNTLRFDANLVYPFVNGLLRANGTGAATQAMPGKDYLASNGVERITASETAPTNPQVGDLWLQLTYA